MIVDHLKIIIVSVFRTSDLLMPVLQHAQSLRDLLNPLLYGIHHCPLQVAHLSTLGVTSMFMAKLALLRVLLVGELQSAAVFVMVWWLVVPEGGVHTGFPDGWIPSQALSLKDNFGLPILRLHEICIEFRISGRFFLSVLSDTLSSILGLRIYERIKARLLFELWLLTVRGGDRRGNFALEYRLVLAGRLFGCQVIYLFKSVFDNMLMFVCWLDNLDSAHFFGSRLFRQGAWRRSLI